MMPHDSEHLIMGRLAYFRVSTADQSLEAQRDALGGGFDREFSDSAVSGAVPAAARPGFADLLRQARRGDTLHVTAVDRLGRDALDVQATVRQLAAAGVEVHVLGLGTLAGDAGGLILAVLAQVAELERRKIAERTEAGRQAARKALRATGKTHRGKDGLGRRLAADPAAVNAWRRAQGASVTKTAVHFKISPASVKRYWRLASTIDGNGSPAGKVRRVLSRR